MKRIELLLYHKEREQFLKALREIGVVHVTEKPEQVERPHVQELHGVIRLTDRTIAALQRLQKEKGQVLPQVHNGNPHEQLRRFEELEEQKEKAAQELLALKKDAGILAPWGNFNPESIKRLQKLGVKIRFFVLPLKKFESLDRKNLSIEEINRSEGQVYFVLVERGEQASIDAEEVRLPDSSLETIQERIKDIGAHRAALDESTWKMTAFIDFLQEFKVEKINQYRYERAHHAMQEQADGKLLTLTGWFPGERENRIREFLGTFPSYFTIRDPLENEDVPVKLKNHRFPTLFEPITGMYSLPVYNELDLTPFMAPFFAIFFGLCLGDMGYGLLLLIGSLIARTKVSGKLKSFMSLGIVLGSATAISGFLLNSFFGRPIFGGPGVQGAFLETGLQTFAPLSAQTTDSGQIFPALSLALLLGFIQILFGMSLQAYVKAKYGGFAAGLQPVASIMIVFGAVTWAAHANFLDLNMGAFTVGPIEIGKMLLAVPLRVAKGLTYMGLILYFVFNNLDKKVYLRPLTGLWEFYNFTTGMLGNILSYLRLFALGLAGGLLGAAFNQIAFMFITAPDGTINYASAGVIGTILVLIFGHALNLALSALGAFVHPLRLTFVEFYGAVGFKGGSKPYMPFAKVEQ